MRRDAALHSLFATPPAALRPAPVTVSLFAEEGAASASPLDAIMSTRTKALAAIEADAPPATLVLTSTGDLREVKETQDIVPANSIAASLEGRTLIEEDGFVFDAETGEILAAPDDAPASVRERFAIVDQSSAEWVLNKMLQAEADYAAIGHHPDVIRAHAIIDHAEAMKRERMRRIEGLHRRFDAELGEFARTQLAGKKTKTWKTVLGSVALKIKKGGLKVADKALALAWAEEFNADAIKVEKSFLISAIGDAQKAEVARIVTMTDEEFDTLAAEMASDPDVETESVTSYIADRRAIRSAFRVEPDREDVIVKTGVDAIA
jgi:hypothetical protein